jgi:hypothetical protein
VSRRARPREQFPVHGPGRVFVMLLCWRDADHRMTREDMMGDDIGTGRVQDGFVDR